MNEEHNMTLREKWEVYALSTIADHDELNTNDVFNWFLAQFDAMLAEDIEKIQYLYPDIQMNADSNCVSFVEGSKNAIKILEARRESIKKQP